MSHTIIRSFKATKEKLFYEYADSNIHPYLWREYEEDATTENISRMVKAILWREWQPYESISLGRFTKKLFNEYQSLKTVSCFERDWQYNIERSNTFDKLFVNTIGLVMFNNYFFDEKLNISDFSSYRETLIKYEEESKRLYKEEEIKQKENKIIHTRCAIYSDIFQGHDILIDDNECLIIAKKENYDNRGHLDNKDESAIFLDGVEASRMHLYFLSSGSSFNRVDDEVYEKIENKLLESNVNLYNSFHILRLAKKSICRAM